MTALDAASDFATKLRLTAAALGCSGHKELCARFRAANPTTHFDLERAYKWFQGRALPRSRQVYDDWAKVLGTQRSGTWLAVCSTAAFLEELCALHGLEPEALLQRLGTPAASAPARPDALGGYLYGTYACYSLAWSPYYRGQLIRGSLLIAPGRGRSRPLVGTYREALLGRSVEFKGEVRIAGRSLHANLCDPESGLPLFMSLFLPGPPASVLCGILSGATVVGPDPQPSATRIAVIRVPNNADGSNRYLEPRTGAVACDLTALGLPLTEPAEVDALLRGFLLPGGTGGLDQVSATDQAQLAIALDKAYLRAR